jgi:hypothetical protein
VLVCFLSRHACPLTQERDDGPGNPLGLLEPRPVTDTGQDFDSRTREDAALALGLLDRDVDVGTDMPSRRQASAVARPMPRAPPVITTR